MPGIGTAIGWLFDLLGSKNERRRNAIQRLEKRQKFIETNLRNDLSGEYERNKRQLDRLYDEAKNA